MDKFSNNYIKIQHSYYRVVDSEVADNYYLVNITSNSYLTVVGRSLVDTDKNLKAKSRFLLNRESADKVFIGYQGRNNLYSAVLKKNDFKLSLDQKTVFECVPYDNLMVKTLEKVDMLTSEVSYLKQLFIRNFPITNVPNAVGKLRQYQLESLNLMIEFDRICEKLGIKFWMTGGTLLGAVRHFGYIPWDDDIDVCMMIDDFEVLVNYFSDNHRFVSVSSESEKTKILRNSEGISLVDFCPYTYKLRMFNSGVYNPFIDIFVLYYIPSDRTVDQQYALFRELNSKSKVVLKEKGVLEYRSYLLEGLRNISSKQVTENVFIGLQTYSKMYRPRSIHDIFPLVKLKFEDYLFNAPRNHLKILTEAYGDFYSYPESFKSHIFK